MNQELSYKLVKRFPILYQDFGGDPRQSCMAWGFDHGDGWFLIIWQLSLAINEELGYDSWWKPRWYLFKKRWFGRWNSLIYKLSPPVQDKTNLVKCKDNVWRHVIVEKVYPRDQWLRDLLVRFLPDKSDNFGSTLGHFQRLGVKALVRFPYTGVAVGQVKEKIGTLRFYSAGNDQIFGFIRMAERLSAATCESRLP
jgi:hypothetical protein